MKATHNIKVNGVWYKVGEEIAEVSSSIADTNTAEEIDKLFDDSEVVATSTKKTTKKSTKK